MGDCVCVCVMSGNFVQRGDFAVMNKAARAEAAVKSGVDLVLELPTPLALSSAERFAASAVRLLSDTGVVDYLSFGSECGDVSELSRAADALLDERFPDLLMEELAAGVSFAAARQAAARRIAGDAADVLSRPNDILGVEYVKAVRRHAPKIEPIAIRREGGGHDGGRLGALPSASAIRAAIYAGDEASAMRSMTAASAEAFAREAAAGRAPARLETCERAMLARLRGMSEDDWRAVGGTGEGLYHRFFDAARQAAGFGELLAMVKSKRYALSRIRRAALCAYLGIRESDVPDRAPYIRPLAFNERGREALAEMKRRSQLPILTKPADVRKIGGAALGLFETEARCTDLYTLCYPRLSEAKGGSEWRMSPSVV
jgi:predicted nucleotidyltransferase